MTKERGSVVRYSLSFKQRVIREMEEQGLTKAEISRKYGIKGVGTVHKWICKFGKNNLLNKNIRIETMEEKDRLKQLQEEIKRLKLALADSQGITMNKGHIGHWGYKYLLKYMKQHKETVVNSVNFC